MTSLWHVYARALYTAQLRTLFGMVGDGVGLLEAAAAQGGFQILEAYDQRAAVGMAIGFAQATRRCAVLAASPGPGLANAAMGILEAASLQTPLLILSNGVSRRLKGTGAFQEFDTLRFMPAITKWAYRVESSHRVMWALERALHLALNGRKGPVFLELPDDLIALKTPLTDPLPSLPLCLRAAPDPVVLEALAQRLSQAERPLFILGGGCLNAGADSLVQCVERSGAAVLSTATGRGAIPEDHPAFCGLMGLYLSPPAESLIKSSDFILIAGSQLEETCLIGLSLPIESACIVQMDADPEVIGRSIKLQMGLLGDVALGFDALARQLTALDSRIQRDTWAQKIQDVQASQHQSLCESLDFKQAPVRMLFSQLNKAYGPALQLVLENGLQDMWGYFFPLHRVLSEGRSYGPGEQTGLGLALGVAVGVKAAYSDRPVVAVVGDGAFSFGRVALWTARKRSMGITVIVINNRGFAWPRLFQQADVGCTFDVHPSLEALAHELQAFYSAPTSEASLQAGLGEAAQHNLAHRLALIELCVEPDQDIPVGVQNHYLLDAPRAPAGC